MTMQSVFRSLVFALGLFVTISARAELTDEYYLGALGGARVIWFHFTESDDAKCRYKHDLREQAAPLLSELSQLGLEVRDEIPSVTEVIPDLAVLVSVGATGSQGNMPESGCLIFVKLEAIHSMLGTLRYQSSPIPLRVIAYKTLRLGFAPQEDVGRRLHDTALHAIAVFANAYFLANRK